MHKILIVDDEIKACDFLRKILESKGFSVTVSYSGESALEKVKTEMHDVVLLDIKMPGMDGMETLRRIRQFDNKVVIIMLTAVHDEGIAKDALTKGADDYMTKPINVEYLVSLMIPVYTEMRSNVN
ncbi:MAG: two-component response regulator [Candidatus Scalindua rubra]|uniref:Two-component response regulator n=1 Tax=Candidatus Scalindua rubra TaxID=1872076 RepID=A0A1E3X9G8_9BACT|nr:MAG: two-component response regulator [Candidatus Scalindua rubra]